MKKIRKHVGCGVLLAGTVYAAAAHEKHGGYSAGEPGDPKKPAREIVVLMNEMDYTPATIEVKLGEEVMKRLDEIWPGPGGEAPEAYAW